MQAYDKVDSMILPVEERIKEHTVFVNTVASFMPS
jgi:hypothetical protein